MVVLSKHRGNLLVDRKPETKIGPSASSQKRVTPGNLLTLRHICLRYIHTYNHIFMIVNVHIYLWCPICALFRQFMDIFFFLQGECGFARKIFKSYSGGQFRIPWASILGVMFGPKFKNLATRVTFKWSFLDNFRDPKLDNQNRGCQKMMLFCTYCLAAGLQTSDMCRRHFFLSDLASRAS